ncbi:MAG: radical SAM protein [Planctomycetes bacterium]|nr:radical SAM protein [Planctomycetota bacterium]
MDLQSSVPTAVTARLAVEEQPAFAWSFEPTEAFSFSIRNDGLPELADPARFGELRYVADVLRGDQPIRRVAIEPLPAPVPLGETRVFRAKLGLTLLGGEFRLRFGLERHASGAGCAARPIPTDSPAAAFRVKNQIFEAFVELVNACNFRCTFCPQTTLQRKQRPMDFELATKVVRDLADMGHHYPIRVHLLGEPLLYKRFFDFVDMAHDHGQTVFLVTNGSRFDDRTLEGIYRTRLDQMAISLNTPERETYDAQRGTDMTFDAYTAGIRRMIHEIARRGAPPKVWLKVLFDPERRDHPDEIARVNRVVREWMNVIREAKGQPELEAPQIERMVVTEEYKNNGTTIIPMCDGLDMQVTPYHNWGEGFEGNQHFCSFPWRQLGILVDGQATACCVDAEGEIDLGNVREQSVEEIWNGPALQRIRDAFWNDLRASEPRCARCDVRHRDFAEKYRN